jgi:glyoxylase-like metal-dependent hydrolase (beta-lactamase superfamily II)
LAVADSEGVRAVFCGDMVHHPIQLAHPDWSTNFCIDQHQAADARRALLAELADTDAWLIPAHFPESAPCRIRTDGDAYRIAR